MALPTPEDANAPEHQAKANGQIGQRADRQGDKTGGGRPGFRLALSRGHQGKPKTQRKQEGDESRLRKQASQVYNAAEGERAIPTTIAKRADAPADLRALALGRAAATAADDKKAENTLLLDLRTLATVFDFFVICSAPSDRQLEAVASHVREVVRAEFSLSPRTVEGEADSGWMLVDYGDVVVHIMTPRLRAYYGLETLWAHAPVLLRLQ